jgi:hypothetical protein
MSKPFCVDVGSVPVRKLMIHIWLFSAQLALVGAWRRDHLVRVGKHGG